MTTKVPARMLAADAATQAELDAVSTAATNASTAAGTAQSTANAAQTAANANVPLTSGTVQNSTSGVAIDFTGIPATAKRITVVFAGVSTTGTTGIVVQAITGTNTVVSAGYLSTGLRPINAASSVGTNATNGFLVWTSLAADVLSGAMQLIKMTGNTWVSSHAGKVNTTSAVAGGGDVALGAPLTGIRITSANGTDTFDAGSINVLYD